MEVRRNTATKKGLKLALDLNQHIACCHEDNFNAKKSCFICHKELEKVSDTNNILPFWRRLEESFRYPMNTDSIILIIGLSVLTTISSYLPFAIIWYLLLTSALFKYSFCCLENTSNGDMKAPDIGEAYGGGFGLIFSLIFMMIVIGLAIWASFVYVGPMFSSVVGIVLIAGFPAMIINVALTESLGEALNPVKMFNLMSAIGMPHGLLLAFMMIMSGSVSFINSILGQDLSLMSVILQSIVANYYVIVVFHIMGYMIFQFQKELGFQTNVRSLDMRQKKPVLQKHMERIEVLVKEGQHDEVIKGYKEMMESYPEDKSIEPRYFELLLASYNHDELDDFMPDYFNFQLLSNRKDQIPIIYKRVLKIYPEYLPDSAEQRVKLAMICHENGNAVTVMKLINGIYQSFPDFNGMCQACTSMAEALELLPNREKQAAQCRAFLKKLFNVIRDSVYRVASSSDNDKDSETDHAIERESPPRWRSLVQIQDATRGDGASVQYLEWQAIVASLLDRLTDFDLHQNQLAPADAEPVD